MQYIPNPKQRAAHNCGCDEVLFGGSLGSGKSYFIVFHNAMHCQAWGRQANTVLFRRTFDELEGSLIADYKTLFDGVLGVYIDTKHCFKWDNGALTYFRHLQDVDALQLHQGRQYTLIGFDELTHFKEEEYLYLWQRLRSLRNPRIKAQIISASNPFGPGHKWVKARFMDEGEPNVIRRFTEPGYVAGGMTFPEYTYERIFIPAHITDNQAGLKNDPGYLQRLKMTQSPEMFRAMVEGHWDLFEGMAFTEWDEAVHVVKPFNIPPDWKVIRTCDWAYGSPFYFGWLAQDPRTRRTYLIDEWYGVKRGTRGGVSGIEMSIEEARQGVIDQEHAKVQAKQMPAPWYGVADPSLWNRTADQYAIGHRLNQGGALFRAGQRDKAAMLATYHSLLRINPETGKPGFAVFSTCTAFRQAFPQLVLNPNNYDEIRERQEDHPYDSVGYGLVELVRAPGMAKAKLHDPYLDRLSRLPRPI